ncbi:hypothetical protein ACFQZT_22730 [Paenibacillus sp. GCM10027628]|uniref:hypothetical protein n=1 Tax=Paenibacillus sp. GCM10027628 TaxID=3273413 RepID=UPI003634879A
MEKGGRAIECLAADAYPFYDQLSMGKVVLEEQDIQASHQYTSDFSGRTWYRILTKEGYKWVDPQ